MIHFLSSLPRSGSTLLASLLNQNPDVFASNTSNLCELMGAVIDAWQSARSTVAQGDTPNELYSLLRGLSGARYPSTNINFDKGRGWCAPHVISVMKEVQDEVKIVSTVRPVADCMASFAKISNTVDITSFCKTNPLSRHLTETYRSLKEGYELYPDCFLFIEYDDLVVDPQRQLDRVHEFIGIDKFAYDFENVRDSGEQDEAWGIPGLHDVRQQVGKNHYSAKGILGKKLYDFYQGGEFWNNKPEPVQSVDALDVQLQASIEGDFKTAETMIANLRKSRPTCNRVAFNAGWYELHNGDLQAGHVLLDRGREEGAFGNPVPSNRPLWKGEPGTVLINMEGGLGDQIKSLRFAFDVERKGNKVVLACSAELAPMFAESFATVEHSAAGGVFHDYYLPSMSAVIPLGHTYDTIDGSPYIEATANTIPGRVGVRWSGNPMFEHEQHRKFPADLLFDAVFERDCVSLQRDEGADLKPDWMRQADVSDWATTRKSISECELVITSCTSVAHLAGAMGVEVWIIVPILPYYLWALPGNKSPYYDSAILFRQEKYGDWTGPFKKIKEQLKCMHTLKMAA